MKEVFQTRRLVSLDVMRGAIMMLLVLESTRLYDHLSDLSEGTAIHPLVVQLFHHPWNGLRFWDLIQPGFMFIAGTAMAFSIRHQEQLGMTWTHSFRKALKRSGWLFFWGVLDYAVRPKGLSFELWDVLTQLSFTSLVAFLIYRWSASAQIAFSMGLLVLTELLYRLSAVPGFDQPFGDQHNFGNYVDLLLMNKINGGGWVTINCIPTAAHTIWGAIAGKFLLSNRTDAEKIKWLVIAGAVGLVAGFSLDWTATPIIKRIATSSFVLASGGFCFWGLAWFYWWVDVRRHLNNLQFFVVLSMNSLFIYLFIEIVAGRWFNDYAGALTNGLMTLVQVPIGLMQVTTSLVIFGLEWKMCQFLYQKKIFFKI